MILLLNSIILIYYAKVKVPERIRRLVTEERLSFSEKAVLQLYHGPFNIEDLKHSILTGSLIKKERDELGIANFKYTIVGPAVSGVFIYCCGNV
jgi:hypothetical protein